MKSTKSLVLMAVLCMLTHSYAQTTYRIYDLPQGGEVPSVQAMQSGVAPMYIRTTGIVTALTADGFFIQDKVGDNDRTTCDAVFVDADTTGIRHGDELQIVGTYTTGGIAAIETMAKVAVGQTPAVTKLRWPDEAS